MKREGFTLIELLAVIVVLAIIALIAVPIVLNIIEKARQGAAVSSARSYIKATETYVLTAELNKKDTLEKNNKYNVTKTTTIEEKTYQAINDLVDIKGTKPNGNEDYITLGDSYSVVEALLTINGYEIKIQNDEVVSITKNGKTENIDNESIILSSTSEIVEIGSTLQLTANITGNDDKTVTWTSSDDTIATVDSNGLVTGIKDGSVIVTAKTSNGKIATLKLEIGKFLVNNAKVGDYVAYDAGTWSNTTEKPTSVGEFGGYISGQNKANSVDWCFVSSYATTLKGWRILKIENNQVYLVHAGMPECYYFGSDASASVTALNNRAASQYLNSDYAQTAYNMTYDEANIISKDDTLRTTGSSYWLSTKVNDSTLWCMAGDGNGVCMDRNVISGTRPIVILKLKVKTTGKTTDVVGQEAWSLVAP